MRPDAMTMVAKTRPTTIDRSGDGAGGRRRDPVRPPGLSHMRKSEITPAALRSTLLERAASVFGAPVDWSVEHTAEADEERPGPETRTERGRR